jgi:hypothetical protein
MLSDSHIKMCGFETFTSGRDCSKTFHLIIAQTVQLTSHVKMKISVVRKKKRFYFVPSLLLCLLVWSTWPFFKEYLYHFYCLFIRYVSVLKTSRLLALNMFYSSSSSSSISTKTLVGFRPAQLSLSILSRKVLQNAVFNGTSSPQIGGETVI